MLSRRALLLSQAEGPTGRQEQAYELQQSKTLHNVVQMPAPLSSITENLDGQGNASGGEQELSTISLSNHLANLYPQMWQCTDQHCIVAAAACQQQDHPDLHGCESGYISQKVLLASISCSFLIVLGHTESYREVFDLNCSVLAYPHTTDI